MFRSAILLLVCSGSAALFGQEPLPEELHGNLAKWLDTTEPGPEHQLLGHTVGQWNVVAKTWIDGPDRDPIVTQGTASVRWVLGKRFLLELHKSKVPMPDREGKIEIVPFEGVGMTGFDRSRRIYVGTWADTMGTHILTMKGTVDPDGTTIRMFGEMDEPLLGIVGRTVKYEIKVIDQNAHIFSIYDLAVADDYKVIEITYKRERE